MRWMGFAGFFMMVSVFLRPVLIARQLACAFPILPSGDVDANSACDGVLVSQKPPGTIEFL